MKTAQDIYRILLVGFVSILEMVFGKCGPVANLSLCIYTERKGNIVLTFAAI